LPVVRSNPIPRDWRFYAAGLVSPASSLPRRMLILTTGRSGSELLVSLLNAHPDIVCKGELILRPDQSVHPRPGLFVRGVAVTSMREAMRAGKPAQVFGWKLPSNHMRWNVGRFPDPMLFIKESTGPGGLLVVLRRRNFVAQALSWHHAQKTKYHFTEVEQFNRISVDPEGLLSQTFDYEFEDRWLAETTNDLSKVDVTYEDDLLSLENQQSTLDRITDALGLERCPAGSQLKRITPAKPSDRIANLREVRRVFEPTRFAGFLDSEDGKLCETTGPEFEAI
jgi:LPS sulfotransferase NodH